MFLLAVIAFGLGLVVWVCFWNLFVGDFGGLVGLVVCGLMLVWCRLCVWFGLSVVGLGFDCFVV